MPTEEYRSAILDLVYLASCAVNGHTPDAVRVSQMDLTALYHAADHHLLTGITAMALESVGIKNEAFTQAKGKAIRKVAAFDIERPAVLAKLEEAGIWYVPLKGAVLKELYPRMGMRQMSDNDILIDENRIEDTNRIMENLGFSHEHSGTFHNVYYKEPVCSFEMHYALFSASYKRLYSYYKKVKERLLKDTDNRFGYHFSDNDYYIYMIAHEYKHYSNGGTGLRSLLDTYVFCKNKGDALDWSYIAGEMQMLGIADFENHNRNLAMHLFGGDELSAEEAEMMDYVLSSGTYGTLRNRINNQIKQYGSGPLGRCKYFFSRVFLPMHTVRACFPLFARFPILLPFLPLYRLFRGLTERREEIRSELKILAEYNGKE